MTQWIECNDEAANACKRQLHAQGAKHTGVFTDGDLRVVQSCCPVGENFEWLVTVSRKGKPVDEAEAERTARRFVKDIAVSQVKKERNLTSVWFYPFEVQS